MPHIEQPLQPIILSIKVNKYKQLFFSFVFKVMEYPQTHTQKFNLNQGKKRFSLPSPPLHEGGGCCNFWNDPPGRKLLPQF